MALGEISKALGISKTTAHRYLQNLVDEGTLSRDRDRYSLVSSNDAARMSADLYRLSEMKPLHYRPKKGLRVSIYGEDLNKNIDLEEVTDDLEKEANKVLTLHDQSLSGLLGSDKELTPQQIKKLVGKRFALVVTFDGTDYSTLTSEQIMQRRRDAMMMLAKQKRMKIEELAEKLHTNELEARQLLHPLFTSGYATLENDGTISFAMEVEPQ